MLVIGDKRVEGEGEALTSTDTSTGAVVFEGREASPVQVDAAVAAAREAFEAWRDVPLAEREGLLLRFSDLVTAQSDDLARLISREAGKPLWEAKTEAAAVAGKVAVTIDMLRKRRGDETFDIKGTAARTHYKPLGVMAVLGPFNFPMHLANGHMVPALLSGNTVIFKPSELTPACGQRLVELLLEAGLPAGTVNLLQGGRGVGERLAGHDDIDGLLFTGGVKAGLALHKLFADRPDKMLALELGGNNPLIVHSLQDVEAAVLATIQSAYLTAGQRCTCARRLIVTADAPKNFVGELVKTIARIRVGDPFNDPPPFMGPLIRPEAAQAVLAAHDALIRKGAAPLVPLASCFVPDAGAEAPGSSNQNPTLPARRRVDRFPSAFLTPGLLDVTDLPRDDEEIFGPLLQLIRVKDLDAAIAEANNTRFGLAAGILTDDHSAWERFQRRIKAGIVNWNQQLTGASGQLPFGGIGLSGNFRPSGAFAVDYCSYAVGGLETDTLPRPEVTGLTSE